MFSLDGGVKYWLYNKPVDMRKSFNGLSGILTNGKCASLRSEAIVFISKLYKLETEMKEAELDVEIRPWLEDTLRRLPTEKDITMLLPEKWQPVTAK